jgi:hypothetical protein
MGMKQKKLVFFEKNIQNGRLKKTDIFNSPNSQFSFAIDAKGIDVAQPIWLRDCPT